MSPAIFDPDILVPSDANLLVKGISPLGYAPRSRLPGSNGVPSIDWGGAGLNAISTTGPFVSASVNGTGGLSSIFPGTGAAFVHQTDFRLPLNGINWHHERKYSSTSDPGHGWVGEGWWSNEMINITGTAGDEDDNDCDVEFGPHYTLHFTNQSTGVWTTDNNYPYTLTYDSGNDEFILTRIDGYTYVFHDLNVTNTEGNLKVIEDAYGNNWTFDYTLAQLTDITVRVTEGSNHKITYSYFTSGDNNGLLQYIKVFKTTTTTDANLIGKVEHVYHATAADDYGSEDDLMKVIVTRKATNDGDGTLSIEETYRYRYYKGAWHTTTNPGVDHKLRFVLLPENAQRLNDEVGTPESQSNDDFDDYANVLYEYEETTHRARQTQERLPGASCGCGGGSLTTTTYAWSANGGSPTLDEWNLHCVADREDDTRVIFDTTSIYNILTWVVQNSDGGSPTAELIWHFDYGTSGATENRLTAIYQPSACSAYDESSPYLPTLLSSAGVVYEMDYDYATAAYDGYPEKIRIKQGSSGTANTLIAYGRTITARPDLATTVINYESSGESDGRTTTLTYTFYDSGGDKVQAKQIDVTHPSVSAAKNGPASSAVDKFFFDKRTGALRWSLDGEGFVRFYAQDIETGVSDLTVIDVDTASISGGTHVIDLNWDGDSHGGLGADDTVPFSRTGGGTALELASTNTIDWLGRARMTVRPGMLDGNGAITNAGMITYYVYKDDELRTYPAWDTSTEKTLLPIRIMLMDKDGRTVDTVALDNSFDPNVTTNEPNGTTTYANSDVVERTVHSYNLAGMRDHTDRYHTIPATGDGTRYTNYYRTAQEYDSMGRMEYMVEDAEDAPDGSTFASEQVTQHFYDFLGRRTKTAQAVSDHTHDIAASKPTLQTTVEYSFDDADGNVLWVRRYYGAANYNQTTYEYNWRNLRQLTIPPAAPYTLVIHDNLDRATAAGTYSATTNLDVGDDPVSTENGNRLHLSTTSFDERGRPYETKRYDDPGDATPADALANNTYRDRRGLVWAIDAANTGVRFTKYDGAGRRIETHSGTDFDTAKYTGGNKPDYLDDDENIVQVTEYTLDEVGNVQKIISKELNHNDANGMDLTANDDYIRTYVYSWYDAAHRLIDTANFGTNNGDGWKDNSTAPTYGASAPSRSDTVLITTYTYDSEGDRYRVTDPKGIITESEYDQLGRITKKTESKGAGGDDLNRATLYEYNAQGSMIKITADLTTDQETGYVYGDSQNARWVSKIQYPATDTDNGKTIGEPSDETYDRIVFTYNVDGTVATRTDQNGTVLTWSYDTLRRKTEEEVTTTGTYTGGAAAVDGAVRAFTWTYDSEGRNVYLTSHSDTTPDTGSWTDAVNQIKYTYNAADKLTKEEQEVDGAVDGSTLAVEYGYGTDYGTPNYNRLNYVEYPSGRKIWNGYTHSGGGSTFQDTINDKFSRVGQIARDNSGSIGDILAEYDRNGMGRVVRRVHDEVSGAYGNDTKMDKWHGTTGWYKGLDPHGRTIDMKHTEFSGSATDFAQRKYGYDRNSNRTHIEHVLYKGEGQAFTYDNLNRLTLAKRGILDSSDLVQLSDKQIDYGMDLLGNFTSGDGGLKVNNAGTSSITHAVNATNEITSMDRPNPSGATLFIEEPFTTALSSFWSADMGLFIISSNKASVKTVDATYNEAILLADPTLDIVNYQVEVTFPASSSTNKAGLVFCHDGAASYYAVVLDRNAGKIALHKITNKSWGGELASATATISDSTAYTIAIERKQSQIRASVVGQANATFLYDSSTEFGTGQSGLYADKTSVTFDDFEAYDGTTRVPMKPRIGGLAKTTVVSGWLKVESSTKYGGEAIVEGFYGGNYIVDLDVRPVGSGADIWVRYIDSNRGYKVRVTSGNVELFKVANGKATSLASSSYIGQMNQPVVIEVNGTAIKVDVLGTERINTTDSTFSAGGVAFSGEQPEYDNLIINLDTDGDGTFDDKVIDEDFSSTTTTVSHDHAGNLIDDGTFQYIYDAWHRLVKVRSAVDTDVTIQVSEFDARGRRMEKEVKNSGDYDGTVVYLFDGHKIIETRDGSGVLVQQFVRGLRYIDEIVMVRVKGKGELYVHQDANWNVIALTDMGGQVVERITYTPYGEPVYHQVTSWGDRDGDQIVDSTDKGTPGTTCSTMTGACRIVDLDFDGDYDAADGTLFDSLASGLARHPGRKSTAVSQPFGHQGLLYEPELGQYQNRARQYDPGKRRFMQRDPLALRPRAKSGYEDGMSLYVGLGSNPLGNLDPSGNLILPGAKTCTLLLQCNAYVVAARAEGAQFQAYCCCGCGTRYEDRTNTFWFDMCSLGPGPPIPGYQHTVDDIIEHEVIHVLQDDDDPTPDTAQEWVEKEYEAYYWANCIGTANPVQCAKRVTRFHACQRDRARCDAAKRVLPGLPAPDDPPPWFPPLP